MRRILKVGKEREKRETRWIDVFRPIKHPNRISLGPNDLTSISTPHRSRPNLPDLRTRDDRSNTKSPILRTRTEPRPRQGAGYLFRKARSGYRRLPRVFLARSGQRGTTSEFFR